MTSGYAISINSMSKCQKIIIQSIIKESKVTSAKLTPWGARIALGGHELDIWFSNPTIISYASIGHRDFDDIDINKPRSIEKVVRNIKRRI